MKLLPRIAVLALTFGATVGFDQVTKRIATEALKGQPGHSYLDDTLKLVWATNDGAFLSLGGNLPDGLRFWLLTVAVGGLLLGIVIYSLMAKVLTQAQVAGYALIAGGGFANWIDRARFDGKVVDFMNLGVPTTLAQKIADISPRIPTRTGVFNVADLAILAGIGVLLVISRKQDKAAALAARRDAQAQAPGTTQSL